MRRAAQGDRRPAAATPPQSFSTRRPGPGRHVAPPPPHPRQRRDVGTRGGVEEEGGRVAGPPGRGGQHAVHGRAPAVVGQHLMGGFDGGGVGGGGSSRGVSAGMSVQEDGQRAMSVHGPPAQQCKLCRASGRRRQTRRPPRRRCQPPRQRTRGPPSTPRACAWSPTLIVSAPGSGCTSSQRPSRPSICRPGTCGSCTRMVRKPASAGAGVWGSQGSRSRSGLCTDACCGSKPRGLREALAAGRAAGAGRARADALPVWWCTPSGSPPSAARCACCASSASAGG